MIQIIDDIYVFDEDKSLYSMLQSCSIKQLKYLFYTIRNQNFVFINKRSNSQYSLSSISYAISELDKILYEYNQFKKKSKDLATIDVNATEYAEVSVETISIDYTTQFYKDYIIGEELFYNIISKGYTCRFISLIENIPTILNNNDPTF